MSFTSLFASIVQALIVHLGRFLSHRLFQCFIYLQQPYSSFTHDTTAPTNFTQIPSLPREMRVSIWEFLLAGPRVVKVIYNKKSCRTFSPTPPPTLLIICPESRQEALRKFKLLFYLKSSTRAIYINTTVDPLFLSIPPGTLEGEPCVSRIRLSNQWLYISRIVALLVTSSGSS